MKKLFLHIALFLFMLGHSVTYSQITYIGRSVVMQNGMPVNATKPAGAQAGDVLITIIQHNQIDASYTSSVNAPAGWTYVRNARTIFGTAGLNHFIFLKVVGASDPAVYTFTDGGPDPIGNLTAVTLAYRGVDNTTPIDVENGLGVFTTGGSFSTPSVTTNTNNTMLVAVFGAWTDFTGYPAGMIARCDTTAPQYLNALSIVVTDGIQSVTGATGQKTCTCNCPAVVSGWSNTAGTELIALKATVTAINETEADNAFNIFPNPSNGKFTVIANREERSGEQSQIEIYNVLGEKIYSATVNHKQETINLNVPSGVYFVKLKSEKESFIQKLIIQK